MLLFTAPLRASHRPRRKNSPRMGEGNPLDFRYSTFIAIHLLASFPGREKLEEKRKKLEPGIVPHYRESRWRDRGGESRSTCVGIPRKRRRSCSLMDTNLDERARISIGTSSFFLLSSAIERECITFTRRGRELYFSSSESNTRDDKRKNVACATFLRRRKYIIRKLYGRKKSDARIILLTSRYVCTRLEGYV